MTMRVNDVAIINMLGAMARTVISDSNWTMRPVTDAPPGPAPAASPRFSDSVWAKAGRDMPARSIASKSIDFAETLIPKSPVCF